jgi:hypothetical protein
LASSTFCVSSFDVPATSSTFSAVCWIDWNGLDRRRNFFSAWVRLAGARSSHSAAGEARK